MTAQRKLHILVMSAAWQSALGCIQSYGREGHTVSIIRNTILHPNYASVFVTNIFSLDQGEIGESARELMNLVELKGIDLVVPISDQDAALVAAAKQLFPDSGALISSSLESVSITTSRNRTTALCRSLSIATPKTIFATHDSAKAAAGELGYPCFLKLSGTVASQGVFEISGEAELGARLGSIPAHSEMQLQSKIEGDLVGITGFASDGKVLKSFAFGCDYAQSHAGTPAYSKRVRDERLSEILGKIVRELRWTGGIDVDLLQRRDGSLVLLEINPRFSGTMVFALKIGIDFPMYYVNTQMGIGGNPEFTPSRQEAERFVSLLEEIFYLRTAGETGKKYSARFRSDNKWVDNSFWDDWRYSAALFEHATRSLLYLKRQS
jgi:biotin carboxylase